MPVSRVLSISLRLSNGKEVREQVSTVMMCAHRFWGHTAYCMKALDELLQLQREKLPARERRRQPRSYVERRGGAEALLQQLA